MTVYYTTLGGGAKDFNIRGEDCSEVLCLKTYMAGTEFGAACGFNANKGEDCLCCMLQVFGHRLKFSCVAARALKLRYHNEDPVRTIPPC